MGKSLGRCHPAGEGLVTRQPLPRQEFWKVLIGPHSSALYPAVTGDR